MNIGPYAEEPRVYNLIYQISQKKPQFHTISYNNRHDLWQMDINKSDNEDLEDGSETCYDLWFEDGSTEKKEAGVEGKDVQILE